MACKEFTVDETRTLRKACHVLVSYLESKAMADGIARGADDLTKDVMRAACALSDLLIAHFD